MKPWRPDKLLSYLSFFRWLISENIRKKIAFLIPRDYIARYPLRNAEDRISYYCKLRNIFTVQDGITLKQVPRFKRGGYNFDFHRIMAPFPGLRFKYLIGDIQYIPESPAFLRCRQIGDHNENCILLPLNTRRLFKVYKDSLPYEQKRNMSVWRGAVFKQHRIDFLKATQHLSFCDVGATAWKQEAVAKFHRPWLTPQQQLMYKIIFVIEGNDIASNIQWAMSSNSLCFMRKPRYESWFSEGKLIAGTHYVQIADDFSDISEKFNFYSTNIKESQEIIRNAQEYAQAFRDLRREYAIARAVVRKYGHLSGQNI